MLAVTFGLSAVVAVLRLADAVLSGLPAHRVRLNPDQSRYDVVNLGLNLAYIGQLVAWALLGLYLLSRTGIRPSGIGLGRLPGDFSVRWRGREWHFPVASSLLLSLIAMAIGALI